MLTENTEVLFGNEGVGKDKADRTGDILLPDPVLFVCQGRTISEYRLEGRQCMGRPAGDNQPDIPVVDRFASRQHGIFETARGQTYYTVMETTNGILYKGNKLEPGTRIVLRDGDELMIPTGGGREGLSVILIYVSSDSRLHMWRELEKASKDKLTGLCCREGFMLWWYQNYEKKDFKRSCIFILDVDDFKMINDRMGHDAGDAALRLVADKLRESVRSGNQVCRWGGDEFVGVIPGFTEQAGSRLLKLSKNIEESAASAGFHLTVSIGYADTQLARPAYDVTNMVNYADRALYRMKEKGKNGICCYSEE